MIFVYDFVVDLYNVPPTSFSRLPHHSFPPPQPPNALARPSLLLGIETIAHLRQPANAKLTIMFVALSGGPRIVRLFGKGRVYERSTREFEQVRVCVRLRGVGQGLGDGQADEKGFGGIDLASGGREDPAWLSSDHRVGRSIRRDCKRRVLFLQPPCFAHL